MALIKCYECGATISDQASACPKCGAPAKNPNNDTENKVDHQVMDDANAIVGAKGQKNTKRIRIWVTAAVLVILSAFIAVYAYKTYHLSEHDKYVLECVETLIQEVGGQSSITLTNDILYYDREQSNSVFVIVEYRGPKGSDVAYFIDKKFQGTKSEYESDGYGNLNKDEIIGIATGNVAIAEWNLMANVGAGTTDKRELVSAAKIARRLHIRYDEY